MSEAIRSRRTMPPLLTVALLLCALLMRIAVPQGWMPMQFADGWRIVLCSGSGPMAMADASVSTMSMAMPAMQPGQHDRQQAPHHDAAEHPCAFSALAMAIAEPALPSLPEPVLLSAVWLATIGRIVTLGHGLAAPPPPATGPPLNL